MDTFLECNSFVQLSSSPFYIQGVDVSNPEGRTPQERWDNLIQRMIDSIKRLSPDHATISLTPKEVLDEARATQAEWASVEWSLSRNYPRGTKYIHIYGRRLG